MLKLFVLSCSRHLCFVIFFVLLLTCMSGVDLNQANSMESLNNMGHNSIYNLDIM